MKTQMTLVMTMAAALAGATAASAGQPERQNGPVLAARAAADTAQQARELATSVARGGMVWTPDVQQAIAAARDAKVWAPDVQQAIATARDAMVWTPDIQQALTAARDAAATWGQMDQERLFAMTYTASPGGQQSDRDREITRAQREKEDAQREKEREKDREQRDRERESSYYDQGQQALDSSHWDRAITSFDRVIELKSNKSDAAL